MGRPDILCLCSDIVIEVKRMTNPVREEPSMILSDISDAQRNWLDWWMLSGYQGYVAVGNQNKEERRLFVPPWKEWIEIEQIVSNGITDTRLYMKDFELHFSMWEWVYVPKEKREKGQDEWICPMTHPIYSSPWRAQDIDDYHVPVSYRFNVKEDKNIGR